ncbi:MAG: hypothetical protein PHG48_04125 [Eubacteriales bacterium]|nr:hypothetical protein [Eubacteriales bacterium]
MNWKMNWFDIPAIIALVFLAITAWRKGLIKAASAILAAGLSIVPTLLLHARLTAFLNSTPAGGTLISRSQHGAAVISFASVLFIFAVSMAVCALIYLIITKILRNRIEAASSLGWYTKANKPLAAVISAAAYVTALAVALNSFPVFGEFTLFDAKVSDSFSSVLLVRDDAGGGGFVKKPKPPDTEPVYIEGFGDYKPMAVQPEEFVPSIGTAEITKTKGISTKDHLIYTEVKPAGSAQVFTSGAITVAIPQMLLSEPAVFAVREEEQSAYPFPAPSGLNLVSAYDISLGSFSELPEAMTVDIRHDGEKRAGALYYNEAAAAWDQVPWERHDGFIRIKTSHLSTFAVYEEDDGSYYHPAARTYFWYPSSSVSYSLSEINKIMADGTGASASAASTASASASASAAGWQAAKSWFDIGSLTASMVNDIIYEVPGLAKVNDVAGKMGLGFSAIQILADVVAGKAKSAGAQAYEATMAAAVMKLGIKSLSVAFIGVSVINQTIVNFAKAAIAGKEKIYEDAYNLYYSRSSGIDTAIRIRGAADWYNSFYALAKNSSGAEAATQAIKQDIDNYVGAFWSDTGGRSTAYAYVAQRSGGNQAFGFDAGVSADLKKRLGDLHKEHLSGFLNNILRRVIDKLEEEEKERFQKEEMRAFANELNRSYTLALTVKSGSEGSAGAAGSEGPGSDGADGSGGSGGSDADKIGGLTVRFNSVAEAVNWGGTTSPAGKFSFTFTLLGYLRAGMPDKVTVVDKEGKAHEAAFGVDKSEITIYLDNEEKEPALGLNPDKTRVSAGEPVTLNPVLDGNAVPGTDITWTTGGGVVSKNVFIPYSKPGTYTVEARVRTGSGTYETASVAITVEEDLIDRKIREIVAQYAFEIDPDIDYGKLVRVVRDGGVFYYMPEMIGGNPTPSYTSALPGAKYCYGIHIQFARRTDFDNTYFFALHPAWPGGSSEAFNPKYNMNKDKTDVRDFAYAPLDLAALTEDGWAGIVPVTIEQYKAGRKYFMQMSFYHLEQKQGSDEYYLIISPAAYPVPGDVHAIVRNMWQTVDMPKIATVIMHGESRMEALQYWPNGNLKEKITAVNGQVDGEWAQYWPNNTVRRKDTYIEGVLQNESKIYPYVR